MEVEFDDETLALIETERAAETRLPVAAIRSARHKLNLVRAAPDERTLRQWKSLNFHSIDKGAIREGSIYLTGKWKLSFNIDERCVPGKVTIKKLEDLQQGAA